MIKNRKATEQRILKAVQSVLIQQGASSLGVNTIAKEAGVSKVLIYRYFGSYEKLIRTFIDLHNPFERIKKETIDYVTQNRPDMAETFYFFFSKLIDYLYENPEFKEILIWELAFANEITSDIARKREESYEEIFAAVSEWYPSFDRELFPGISSVFVAALFYLSARSKTVESFSGIDLQNSKVYLKNTVKHMLFKLYKN